MTYLRSADTLQTQITELAEKHDKIADMKAAHDSEETVDQK